MLPKNKRINNRGGFTYIYSHGLRSRGTFGTLFAVTPKEKSVNNFKFGFVVSKKIGGAVQRNLMRRRLSSISLEWMKSNSANNFPSFNSVYSMQKYADSFDELKKDFFGQCDYIVLRLK